MTQVVNEHSIYDVHPTPVTLPVVVNTLGAGLCYCVAVMKSPVCLGLRQRPGPGVVCVYSGGPVGRLLA